MQTRYSIQPKRNRAPFKTADGTDTDHELSVQIHEREIHTPFNCSIVRFSSTRFRFLWGSMTNAFISPILLLFASFLFLSFVRNRRWSGSTKGNTLKVWIRDGAATCTWIGKRDASRMRVGSSPSNRSFWLLSFHFPSVCAIALFFACHCGVVGWLCWFSFSCSYFSNTLVVFFSIDPLFILRLFVPFPCYCCCMDGCAGFSWPRFIDLLPVLRPVWMNLGCDGQVEKDRDWGWLQRCPFLCSLIFFELHYHIAWKERKRIVQKSTFVS